MRFLQQRQQFIFYWSLGILLFSSLFSLSFYFDIYEVFPAYGFIGYSVVIFIVMVALSKSWQPWHFVLVSISLILLGISASLDIVLSKDDMIAQFNSSVMGQLSRSGEHWDDYVDVLLIVLNVFTSAIAGNALFYGLNKRNFSHRG